MPQSSESVCWCVLWHDHETLQPSVQVSPVLALQFPFRKKVEHNLKNKKKQEMPVIEILWCTIALISLRITCKHSKIHTRFLHEENGSGERVASDTRPCIKGPVNWHARFSRWRSVPKLFSASTTTNYYLSSTAHAKSLHACTANLF